MKCCCLSSKRSPSISLNDTISHILPNIDSTHIIKTSKTDARQADISIPIDQLSTYDIMTIPQVPSIASFDITNVTPRISPNCLVYSDLEVPEISTVIVYDDISNTMEPIKNMFRMDATEFDNVKSILTTICSEYSKFIITEVSKKIDDKMVDIGKLKQENNILQDEHAQLTKKYQDLEHKYGMILTGNF